MRIPQDACPYGPTARAAHCPGCCARHDVPPCAKAWLQSQAARRLLLRSAAVPVQLVTHEGRRAA